MRGFLSHHLDKRAQGKMVAVRRSLGEGPATAPTRKLLNKGHLGRRSCVDVRVGDLKPIV
jgi:hypothetical protein